MKSGESRRSRTVKSRPAQCRTTKCEKRFSLGWVPPPRRFMRRVQRCPRQSRPACPFDGPRNAKSFSSAKSFCSPCRNRMSGAIKFEAIGETHLCCPSRSLRMNVHQVREWLTGSPSNPGVIASGLVGWETTDGHCLCSVCVGRLGQRGIGTKQLQCSIPVWNRPIKCEICDKSYNSDGSEKAL